MRNAWRIAGGTGAAANTANRRVLVTDKNGRQSVQTVNHELGMNARDMKDVRGRLARQGLAADDDVGMYGGVDTRDKPRRDGGAPAFAVDRAAGSTGRPRPRAAVGSQQQRPGSSGSGTGRRGYGPGSSGNILVPGPPSPAWPAPGGGAGGALKRPSAYEKNQAATTLAAAFRGRLDRKKTAEMRRFEEAASRRKAEEDAEAARPKGRQIYRPQGRSYQGF